MKNEKLEMFFLATIIIIISSFAAMISGSGTVFGIVMWTLIVSVTYLTNRKKRLSKNKETEIQHVPINPTSYIKICPKCKTKLNLNDKFCKACGYKYVIGTDNNFNRIIVSQSNYDEIFRLDQEAMLTAFINRELKKAQFDPNKMLPADVLKRKNNLSIIFNILVFIYISLIFFHFPTLTYIIGLVILIVFYRKTKKYDLMTYLKKEIKARPGEKVSNIIMHAKSNLVTDNKQFTRKVAFITAIVLPLIIFMNPHIMYEETSEGYAVRFYTFGLSNFTSATIPATHNGKDVVSLRGNTFSNMPFLTTVSLPDTIVEIRGQAFKNDVSLIDVNIPVNLKYLGGGAFYNCMSIRKITLPDSLTELGGESFYGASNLEEITLSKNLTEIRGNTFENCTSLETITIPDKVTRIGGHAFYNNSSLSKVNISEYSQLNEIGSSAFRLCGRLYEITLPRGVYINERAFKESPTRIYYFDQELIDRDISGNNTWLKKYEKVTFTDYNISVSIKTYDYNQENLNKGTIIIDFNDEINNDIRFSFSSNATKSDIENDAVKFVYKDYIFQVLSFQENQMVITINKNIDYKDLKNKESYSFGEEGDSLQLSNSNYIIKLEKKEQINGRINYYFSCNGSEFNHSIGNGYYTSATYNNDEVKIQLSSFYGAQGIYLNIYYN